MRGIEMEALRTAQTLSANQQRALVALLSTRTIVEAAEQAELGESTVRRYLQDDTFKQAYHEERSRMLAEGVARLQQGAVKAADVFLDALEDKDPEVRIRAGRSLWEFKLRGVETERKIREQEEILERLEQLEQEYRYGH
jgi:HEAT repeat protein